MRYNIFHVKTNILQDYHICTSILFGLIWKSVFLKSCSKGFSFSSRDIRWYTNQRATSYHRYEFHLLHELRVMSYIFCMNYAFVFAYELQVTVYCTCYEFLFTYELRVTFYYMSISYFLHTSYESLYCAS